MRSLYLECNMGAAGDMLCAALYELLDDKETFLSTMNALLPGVRVSAVPDEKCGIKGTRLLVTVHGEEEACYDEPGTHAHEHPHTHDDEHEHAHCERKPHQGHAHLEEQDHVQTHTHSSLAHIRQIIQGMDIPQSVRDNAQAIYALLADAESAAHGKEVEPVHIHEVGALDAVADIVGFCLLVDLLKIVEIIASPVHVGSGMVRTAHGVLPVPAPATARLLLGVPAYSDGTEGELCTPTGAALLKHFAAAFRPMPAMATQRIGYGMGKKVFPAANCVRAFLFEQSAAGETGPNGRAVELRCNLDDMTPEAVGCATQALLREGALDVYVQQVLMKKNRPGFVIVCLCLESDADRLACALLRHTTTIGVRRFPCERYMLARSGETISTIMGNVRIKRTEGYGVKREKPEYDDVARLANERGISFLEAEQAIREQLNDFPRD